MGWIIFAVLAVIITVLVIGFIPYQKVFVAP